MSKKSIGKNYIYNVIYQILLIVVPLITTPYISRVLGPEGNGTYSYTYSIVTYFVLVASLGTQNYGQREVAYVQNDKKKVSQVFWELVAFRGLMTIIAGLCYFIFLFTVSKEERLIYCIQGLYIVAVAFDITWFFQGLEEFGKVVFRNCVVKIVNIIYIFTMVKSKDDVIVYIGGLAVLTLVGQISIWPYISRYVEMKKPEKFNPLRGLKDIISLFIPTVAIQVYTVIDKTMIGIYDTTMVENGYYEQAQKIVKMSLTVLTSLSTVMIPRIAMAYANREKAELKRYMYNSFRFIMFLAFPMMIGVSAITGSLVPWFFGNGYEKVKLLIPIFSTLYIFIGFSNIIGIQYLVPTKRQNVLTVTVVCGACINFVLNLVMIPRWYSVGAAISSIIAECAITCLQLTYVIRGEKLIKLKDLLRPGMKYMLSAVVMGIVIKIEAIYMSETIITTAFMIATGCIVYVVCLLICKDDVLTEFIDKMKMKIGRNF